MKKIVRMKFGSHLYGLSTPESDTDYKGIYLPELDDLLLGKAKASISHSTGDSESKNEKDDIDDDWYSLAEFVKLACKGETVALDMLHASTDEFSLSPAGQTWGELTHNQKVQLGKYGDIWKDLVSKRHMFYSTNLKSYMGYVKKQAAKYGLKGSRIAAIREAIEYLKGHTDRQLLMSDIWLHLPENEFVRKIELPGKGSAVGTVNHFYQVNIKKFQSTAKVDYVFERLQTMLNTFGDRALLAEKNEGVDWKAVSHALRAGYQMRSIFIEGEFSYPLKETEFLMQVKTGQVDYKSMVGPALENLVEEIDQLVLENKLGFQENSDTAFWDKWLLTVYKDELFGE